MIKEALQYLVSLGEAKIQVENGQSWSDKPLHLIKEPTADPFTVQTLSGLVDYLKSNFDGKIKVFVNVLSPTEVHVTSPLNGDADRDFFIKALASPPDFNFDRFYDAEPFNIKLQSCFVPNDDRATMLKIVGTIKEEMVKESGDDGISQKVVARTGVATVGNVKVPNPVRLKPYRTFVEVNQPESEFVFRMQSGPSCALFEADGGAWKLTAMNYISTYLQKELSTEIEAGQLVIIA